MAFQLFNLEDNIGDNPDMMEIGYFIIFRAEKIKIIGRADRRLVKDIGYSEVIKLLIKNTIGDLPCILDISHNPSLN